MALQNKVIVDTNALLYIEKFKMDLFEEIRKIIGEAEYCITMQVLEELKRKEAQKMKKEVKIAREIMKKNDVKVIQIKADNADDSLLQASLEGYIVATNDRELKKRIKEFGGKVIYLRKRKILELE